MKPADSGLFFATLLVALLGGTASCKSDETPVVNKPMNLDGQVEFSIKDLARRLDVPPESIKVSGARPVTWRSGALGCPESGMNYTQALVPGSVIYLQVDNTIHAYHGKTGAEPFYCPRERAEQPVLDDDLDPT